MIKIYDNYLPCLDIDINYKTEIKLYNSDIIDIIYNVTSDERNSKICCLDNACYKEPAPYFLKGASGVEESLCKYSNLYNILTSDELKSYFEYNKNHLNKGLYLNRAFYIENVEFNYYKNFKLDILGVTAPDKKNSCLKYNRFSVELNTQTLKERIKFILKVALNENVDILILSNFGCNVYGQDPVEVANIFKTLLETEYKNKFKQVIFSIIDKNHFNIFKSIFNKK